MPARPRRYVRRPLELRPERVAAPPEARLRDLADQQRAARPTRRCRLPSVSDGGTTRRRFLETSAQAAVASWLAKVAGAAPRPGGAKVLETLPFVGEGSFPVETTVGEGLGKR